MIIHQDQGSKVALLGNQEAITSMVLKRLQLLLKATKYFVKFDLKLVKTSNLLLSFDDFIDKYGSETISLEKGINNFTQKIKLILKKPV